MGCAIAIHFAKISQLYPPLNLETLPEDVKQKLLQPSKSEDLPVITDQEVYQTMKSVNCTKSAVPGDLPPRLSKEFAPELATPASAIFNSIVKRTVHSGINGVWPGK